MSDKVIEPIRKFKTKFDEHKRVYAVAGDTEIPVRKARNVNGSIVVDTTKEVFPLREYINSFKDLCDIEVLLKRFEAGDLTVMDRFKERTAADYVDISNIPDNFTDMMGLVHESQMRFNELPTEIKEKFDNNFEKWAGSANSKEWLEKMGYVETSGETAPVAEAVKAEDSSSGK